MSGPSSHTADRRGTISIRPWSAGRSRSSGTTTTALPSDCAAGDPARLRETAGYALSQGLAVWFSPFLVDAAPDETLQYLAECARVAEDL
ncbi:MAG TPA: hypothetical protein HA263_03910 [Methanoregulaceae archaeon]|nr:hypothetical protein [Methanoregulaceae archaeon]